METKYYAVEVKCGHVGRSHYIPIVFPVAAPSKKEAARIARFIPRVKRNHEDAVLDVRPISYLEFNKIKLKNNYDKYLKCGSRHEQNQEVSLENRILIDERNKKVSYDHEKRQERVYYSLKREELKLKSFLDSYYDDEMEDDI